MEWTRGPLGVGGFKLTLVAPVESTILTETEVPAARLTFQVFEVSLVCPKSMLGGSVSKVGEVWVSRWVVAFFGTDSKGNKRRRGCTRLRLRSKRGELRAKHLQSSGRGLATGDDREVVGGDTTGPREEDGLALEQTSV